MQKFTTKCTCEILINNVLLHVTCDVGIQRVLEKKAYNILLLKKICNLKTSGSLLGEDLDVDDYALRIPELF